MALSVVYFAGCKGIGCIRARRSPLRRFAGGAGSNRREFSCAKPASAARHRCGSDAGGFGAIGAMDAGATAAGKSMGVGISTRAGWALAIGFRGLDRGNDS